MEAHTTNVLLGWDRWRRIFLGGAAFSSASSLAKNAAASGFYYGFRSALAASIAKCFETNKLLTLTAVFCKQGWLVAMLVARVYQSAE